MGNGYNMWEMALVFEKGLKYVEHDVDMWEMEKKYVGKWLKHLRKGLHMWEMT